ncbi:MAG TPA: HAD-IB family hydrolase [Nitrospiria bacterium]|nr:HAD-IB family hydrolase [Nitrospiria bacterium]
MNLALFDFDGTISDKDSFIDLIIFIRGRVVFFLGILLLSPVLLLYKLGVVPNWKAKEIVIGLFLKGMSKETFETECRKYSKVRLPAILRKRALEKLAWHKARQDRIVIVTASMDSWLKDWCECEGFDLISTRLETREGILTGKLATKNCYGMEKVRRIMEKYSLADFEEVYAYGDNVKDKEMLSLANVDDWQA